MCDELTAAETSAWLSRMALSRRDFARLGAGAAAIAGLPGCKAAPTIGSNAVAVALTLSDTVSIPTPDGEADALFVRPRGGRHPAVILWPDIAGLRDAYRQMGTRLAEAGYAVLVVNQYYRSARAPVMQTIGEYFQPEAQARMKPMIAAITPAGIASDAAAFVAWLDARAEVDTARKVGTAGYCMTGPYTLRTAAAAPARVGAACSFHGANMVNDTPDSPHRLIPQIEAAMLIAIAQNDDEKQPNAKAVLRETADGAHKKAEIEVYPAQHGWCTPDHPVYDSVQAERAWGRLLATLSAAL